jgi:hypothetical protein
MTQSQRLLVPFLTSTLAALSTLAAATSAAADPLTPDDMARLAHGETLIFEKTVVNDSHRYIGGITYTIVEASPDELGALLEDTEAYRELLPKTKGARLVAPPTKTAGLLPEGRGRDFFVELRQGTSLVETVYTLHLRKVNETRTVQFWMDPRMPHGIDDAWGFFRYQAMSEPSGGPVSTDAGVAAPSGGPTSALLTYAILVDVGPGIVRELFEEKVRRVLLSVPQRVRTYVQGPVRAARRTKKS